MTTELTISADELEGTTASVSVWLVNEGDIVSAGQPVLELETDKVSMEVCAHQSGVLSDIQVKVGEDVEADMALAHIRPADTETVSEDSVASTEKDVEESSTETVEDKAKHRLSPAVRRLMQENQLTAEEVTGSGRNGRVTREDVEQYLAQQQITHEQNTAIKTDLSAPTDTPAVNATSRKVPHTRIRKSIADHMVSSLLHTSPHVTSVFEMDMSNIIAHRKWHKNACARVGGKLTFTAYFAYAAA
ncbi:MAG: biotin/lipoyl-containing protein, partial [Gammaproteobacteria bacterium]